MWLSFIQLTMFRTTWGRLGMTDGDLQSLKAAILADPTGPPVVRGTGGLRKVRFARSNAAGGKSGGMRVCYAHFRDYGLVYLCAVYPKSDKSNLTAAERNGFRRVLAALDDSLRTHLATGRTP